MSGEPAEEIYRRFVEHKVHNSPSSSWGQLLEGEERGAASGPVRTYEGDRAAAYAKVSSFLQERGHGQHCSAVCKALEKWENVQSPGEWMRTLETMTVQTLAEFVSAASVEHLEVGVAAAAWPTVARLNTIADGGGEGDADGEVAKGEAASAPAVAAVAVAEAALPQGWESAVSRTTGKVYYVHVASGESTWDRWMVDRYAADEAEQVRKTPSWRRSWANFSLL
jgi:hypothetical protein